MVIGLGLHDVVVRYPGLDAPAVDRVSVDVAPGEVLALLGPSGCGKSSLLRAVAGLEPLASGSVTWDGVSVADVPVHRRGFGLVFQDGQLFTHRDVLGNVAYGLRGSGQARVSELLELVGLAGYERRAVATLSGGERQRVALARALAPSPRLLLLDEPLSALDRSLRERLAVDLRAVLVATGTTAVLVTHDQDEAFAVADRVAVIAAGVLLQVASPPDLWRRPASREVARFLGYEAFVPASSAAAAPLRDLVPPGSGSVLALAEGAFVVDPVAPVAKGTVVGITSRRGRSEVRVDVPGIGPVTALGPVGARWAAGDVVGLGVDGDAVAALD
nr:ABC transporter ATP-binding protein [Cellulomonas sp. PhB150]